MKPRDKIAKKSLTIDQLVNILGLAKTRKCF
mgnify:CR=1 FL=1